MAVLAIFTGKGITKDKYEALRKEVDWEHKQAAGGVFHAAAFDPSGDLHVADVWESPETMNAFVEARSMPAMQKLKISPPSVEVFPLHNANAYKTIDKYKL